MNGSRALFFALLFCLGTTTSACQSPCNEATGCLLPDQCNGAPNLQRYALSSGHYVISQSAVGVDSCQSGRKSGDWNGLSAEFMADQDGASIALRVSNGVDLGHGARNPQPDCNTASLSRNGVAQTVNGCTFTASFSTLLEAGASNELYLSITEQHADLSGSCPIPQKSCLLVYDATLQ